MTALHHACSAGQIDVVRLLLERGANVNDEVRSAEGETPLCVAVQNGDAATFARCWTPAEVNILTANGSSPILMAAQLGCVDVVKLLVEHAANVHLNGGDLPTPICAAAAIGSVDIVQQLARRVARVDDKPKPAGGGDGHRTRASPLVLAAMAGHIDVVRPLVELGADPDPPRGGMQRGLVAGGAQEGGLAVAKYLHAYGARFDPPVPTFTPAASDDDYPTPRPRHHRRVPPRRRRRPARPSRRPQ
ncbi:ankyrin repeat-containing domain protein [Zopfochytrium polystomum]|nr:ankyrin repeat-containing domain protein [Zopfochytrium polystomum]